MTEGAGGDFSDPVESEANPRQRGNASANNGRGGNYDRTEHDDNGKGNGQGRR